MGDMADNLTEQELDFYFQHLSGNCRDSCPYCEKEELHDAILHSEQEHNDDA